MTREIPMLREFLISDDPFLRISRRLHVTRADGKLRTGFLVALTWIPLCVGALMRLTAGQAPAPILFDISVHTRLLIVIPLLVTAEGMLERRCYGSVRQLYDGPFCDAAKLDPIVARADRLRDSRFVELAIFVIAILAGQAALWGVIGSTGMVSGVDDPGALSFARIWYASVALPIMQFLAARWMWHWLIWTYMVLRISRLDPATIGTHPDHAGGIGFLATPISAFTVFVFAISSNMSSAWGTQMLQTGASLQSFVPTFVAFVLVAAVLGCGPLLAYVGNLYRARYRAADVYSRFALDYVRRFHRKWIEGQPNANELLGSPDIQALNDMGAAFESMERIRIVPFGAKALAGIWLAAMIPMIPLVMTTMPIDELLRHIGSKMVGGLL